MKTTFKITLVLLFVSCGLFGQITASKPVTGLDYFKLGSSYYFEYQSQKMTNPNPPKELLIQADDAFSELLKRSPTTVQGYLYRARTNRQLDDKDSRGLGAPFYEQYVKRVTVDKPDLAARYVRELVEAYSYLGNVAANRDGDKMKAKEYFDKAAALQ